ncbi:MAG: hypothetical protein HQK91_01600 [Nitrospirae bacterium]|nr:hypothetical protein [Nitrospirota bacterium]
MGKKQKQENENIIEKIRVKYSYAKEDACIDENCELKLNGYADFVILKGEKIINKDVKKCDFIVFINDNEIKIVISEHKTTNFDVYDIIEKLQNSSTPAFQILIENDSINKIHFFFIALAKKWDSDKLQILTNKKYRISLNSKKYMIIPNYCGKSFNDILKKFKTSKHNTSNLITKK